LTVKLASSAERRMRLAPILVLLVAIPAGLALAQSAGTCVEGLAMTSDHDTNAVRLEWTATAGASAYHVHRTLDGGDPQEVAVLSSNATAYEETAPDGIVGYRVAADGPPSSDCQEVEAHFGGEPPPPTPVQCVEGLATEALPDGTVRLTWEPVPDAVSYEVLRGPPGSPLAPYGVVGTGDTFFVDGAAVVGEPMRYTVAANGLPAEGECPEVQVVAVPFFSPLVGLGLAVAAALGLGLARRRR
jgi:hypothetical protein